LRIAKPFSELFAASTHNYAFACGGETRAESVHLLRPSLARQDTENLYPEEKHVD
jgi:hypothetical protein